MKKTRIEWADSTWNPITGCSKVSEACDNCYAERMATRFAGMHGYPKENPFGVTLHSERLYEPLHWQKPRRIFVCSMSDLFHEDVLQGWVDDIFDAMSKAPQHVFMLLTKRPERMKAMLEDLSKRWISNVIGPGTGPRWPLENVWLGVTAENQRTADERIPVLLNTPAEKHFVSVEPMLGRVDLSEYLPGAKWWKSEVLMSSWLDWVICGGETGPGARPMHPDWPRGLRNQCQQAEVPFFFKQWGEFGEFDVPLDYPVKCAGRGNFIDGRVEKIGHMWNPDGKYMLKVGKKAAGRLLDGQTWDEVPETHS